MEHPGATLASEAVCSSSGGGEFGPGGRSTEMISDGRAHADREVLVERVGENLLPTAQAWSLWPLGPPVAAPRARNSHIDLLGYLSPG
jgi:hypothetical protein